MAADAAQAAKHVAEMASEDASIRMQFVDHDIAEIFKQLRPFRMVRQDARVHHVGVAEDEVRARANGAPGVLGRVAVVGEDADVLAG